jgi:hypothetical protein
MLTVSLFAPLFAWNPDGHSLMTSAALAAALEARGRLGQLGISRWFLDKMTAWMPLNNCSEDVEYANVADYVPGAKSTAQWIETNWGSNAVAHSCAVLLGGDQVKHFMCSIGENPRDTFYRSDGHIRTSAKLAWEWFSQAFPSGPGWYKSLSAVSYTHLTLPTKA